MKFFIAAYFGKFGSLHAVAEVSSLAAMCQLFPGLMDDTVPKEEHTFVSIVIALLY